ncbi:BTAD domain-containing putative transcriptional regulator [Phenylobacterium sp. LjRoot225]|uniref:AfsR/SARP family transcriptional regulator n=1 Tax=Phenylobacterium sp. LjRoot225 TaxID=3342285 RepID=UPI003ECE0B37
MEALTVHLFGEVRVRTNSGALIRFPTRKSKSLLACLAIRREGRALRSSLAGELWPDAPEERAQRALNTEFWRLRTALRDGGADPNLVLQTDYESIGLNAGAPIWVDAAAFERATVDLSRLEASLPADPALAGPLVEAVDLYSGDLMEGIYDDWCLVHREAYRARLIATLELLVRVRMDEQCWEQAIGFGRRLLEIDPLLEHVHRALMRCHHQRGHRAAALKQYEACAAVLRRDLSVEPMESTRLAYEGILAAAPWAPPRPLGVALGEPRAIASPDEMVRHGATPAEKIDYALANLNTARTWLEDAGRSLRNPDPPG